MPPITREIRFEQVNFAYADRLALQNIHLTVPKGEIVALVGSSGSGKTTLVNLLPRFYDISCGSITLDGRDIRDVSLASLRRQISVVTQETFLFNDTFRYNIAYGTGKPRAQKIEEAPSSLCLGFHQPRRRARTRSSASAERLSGGQRQRLAIARAILKDPPILILDEATSALDTESERLVQQALANLIQGRTTCSFAHRLSTIRNAHRIVVLEDGKIVEAGRHEDLLTKGGVYAKLYYLQFRPGEEEPRPESPATPVSSPASGS